jgi:uracil-DNA glycosylase family 4
MSAADPNTQQQADALDPVALVAQVAAALRWARYTGATSIERSWASVPEVLLQPEPVASPGRSPLPTTPARSAAVPAQARAETSLPARPAVPAVSRGNRRDEVERKLADLRTRTSGCERCDRHTTRSQVVHGQGNPMARLMICLVSPTSDDDAVGEPGQGPTGDLLKNMLKAMTLTTADVWLTHLTLCHGPADPTSDQIKQCSRYLRTQLEAISPTVLLVFGELPARFLLQQQVPVGTPWPDVRGQWYEVLEVPALATWSLGDMLRQPALKKEVWLDLQRVMQRLGLR